jgi:hypothetical protein
MPKSAAAAPDRDDEVRVRDQIAVGGADRARGGIGGDDTREPEVDGRQAPEDAARGIGDLLRLESGDRHLVHERQEAVVVARVDPHGRTPARPSRRTACSPAKPAPTTTTGRDSSIASLTRREPLI